MYDENAIIERIKQLRQQHSGPRGKSNFARALDISPSTYSYYESNRVPPIEILIKICKVTDANLEWLLTGQTSGETGLSGPKSVLFKKIDQLLAQNPDLAESINAFVEILAQKRGLEAELNIPQPSNSARPGWIPILGRTAAGIVHFWDQSILPQPQQAVTELDQLVRKHIGRDILGTLNTSVSVDLNARPVVESLKNTHVNLVQVSGQEDEQIVEFVQCEQIYRAFPDSFALHIDGDSMAPRINDGDVVILSPSVPAVQGHAAVVKIANQIGVTCKLIRTTKNEIHLIPTNERYEPKVIPQKDVLWALAVLCHISI
jgi:transcriptional regulator with XRE-family HTH domain